MSGSDAQQPLLSVQVEDGRSRNIPVYTPPTGRAWTSVVVTTLGFLGFGGFAIWSWVKGDNRDSSIVATVAAVVFGGSAVLNFSTTRGLRPRMVSLDAIDRMHGFVPIGELGNTRQEIIDLLEDLARQIASNQTSDLQSSNSRVQTSWQRVNSAVTGILRRRSTRSDESSSSTDDIAPVDRSGLLLADILQQIGGQNKGLQGELRIESIDDRVLGERLLPERDDLGEHTANWDGIDLALRTYTYLQVCSNERRLNRLIAGAYTALSDTLTPMSKALRIDLQECITGEVKNLYADRDLNKSHHALTCGLRALGEKAEKLSASLKRQGEEAAALLVKVETTEEERLEAIAELRELKAKSSSSEGNALRSAELESGLKEAQSDARESKREAVSLREQLVKAHADVERKEEEIEPLTKRALAAEKTAAAKELEVHDLAMQIASLESRVEEIAPLKEKLQVAVEERLEAIAELGELKAKSSSSERNASRIGELESELKEAQRVSEESKREAVSLKEQLVDVRADVERKRDEVGPLTVRALAAEKTVAVKEREALQFEKQIVALKSRVKEIAPLEEKLRVVEHKREQAVDLYEPVYRKLQSTLEELEDAQAAVRKLEAGQEKVGAFVRLAETKIDEISRYESGSGYPPDLIKDRKFPSHDHPFFKVFFAVNGLIRTIQRQRDLLDSSSTDNTPVHTPTKPRERNSGGASASLDDSLTFSPPPSKNGGDSATDEEGGTYGY